jgi:catechol 2,3-dioxygenase-like lactoylglutathione lyase family enzyme
MIATLSQPRALVPANDADGAVTAYLTYEHVLIAIPAGQERRAREFYVDVMGFTEVVRPEALGGTGGGWFRAGAVMLHLGVDPNFHAAAMAHPAFLVNPLAPLIARCEAAGHPTRPAEKLPGFNRVHVLDPFGNRIELMERGE